MRVLVTGSEGTLGRPLVRELEARGHEVWRVDLMHQPGDRFVRADIRSHRQIGEALMRAQPDVVFHLAAEFGRLNGEEYYDTLWQTNVVGTRHIMEWQRLIGFRMVFTSSSEIYGEAGDMELTEGLPLQKPVWPQNDYALTKWINEQQIVNFSARHGTQTMRVRLFNAYGPGERYHAYRSVVCLFAYRALHGLPWDVYEGYHRVFMYVDDLIPTLANALDRFDAGGVVNIGGVEYRSVRELSDLILAHTGADPALVTYLSEDRHNTTNKRPDITKARIQLGHNPTITLEQGIPRTLDWMREFYEIPAQVGV